MNTSIKNPKPAAKATNPIVEQRNRRIRIRNRVRRSIQLLAFLIMPGAFTAGFTGVKQLFLWVGAGEQLQLNSFVRVLIGLCLFTILFGRYFCGYLCAFGSFGDLVFSISAQVQTRLLKRKTPYSLPDTLLPLLQKLKYINLAVIVTLCALGCYDSLSGWSVWEVFSRLTALKLPHLGGILLLLVVVVGMAVQERFFCQFLCPMGAVFSLLPILPTGILHRNAPNCLKNCSLCQKQCPVGLKLEEDGLRNGECLGCERCVAVCPKGNLTHAEDGMIRAELVPMLVKAMLFFGMGCCLGLVRGL